MGEKVNEKDMMRKTEGNFKKMHFGSNNFNYNDASSNFNNTGTINMNVNFNMNLNLNQGYDSEIPSSKHRYGPGYFDGTDKERSVPSNMQKKNKPTNEFGYSNTTTNFHSANKQR